MLKDVIKINGNKLSLGTSYFKNNCKKGYPDSLPDIVSYWKRYNELPFNYKGDDWLYDTMGARQKVHGIQNDQFMTPDTIARQIIELTNNFLPRGNKVLNACCGIGQLTKHLLKNKFDVYAYDSDEILVKTCNLMYPSAKTYTYDFSKGHQALVDLTTVKEWDLIVSNPPSSKHNVTSFLGWLSEAMSNNGKAIVMMPNDFEYKKYNKFYKTYVERFKILTKEDISLDSSSLSKYDKMHIYIMELTEEYKKERVLYLSNQLNIIKDNPEDENNATNKKQIMDKQELRKIQNVRLNKISVNPLNPRKKIREIDIQELAQSIKQIGLLQPITLRKIEQGFEIVAGECRYRAYCLNGEETIPAIIGNYTDAEVMVLALAENMNRNNLSLLEEADAFNYLSNKQYKIDELSLKFGKTENYIRNRLRLLLLIPDFKSKLEKDELTLGASIELSKYTYAIQQEVYETYYKNSNSPLCWNNISKKEVANRLIKLYTMNLNDYEFNKDECLKCQYNTDISTLFDECKGKCTNLECLRNKQHINTIQICKLRVEKDKFEIIISPTDLLKANIEEKLKEEGIVVQTISTFETPEPPQKPNREDFKLDCDYRDALEKYKLDDLGYNAEIDEYEKKVGEGTYKRCLHIGDKNPKICYRPINNGERSKTIKELEEQAKANYQTTKICILKASLELIRSKEITTSEFSLLEEEIFLFFMLGCIKRNRFPLFGITDLNNETLTDQDKESIISKITNQQYGLLKREFILKNFLSLNINSLSPKLQVYLQTFTGQHFPPDSENIVKKYLTIYNKSKDKLEKEIKKIKKEITLIE